MSLPASRKLKNIIKNKQKKPQPPLQWQGESLPSSSFVVSSPFPSQQSQSDEVPGYIQLIKNPSSPTQTQVSLKGLVIFFPSVIYCQLCRILVAASCSIRKGKNIPPRCEMIHRRHLSSSKDSVSAVINRYLSLNHSQVGCDLISSVRCEKLPVCS